MPPLRRIEDRIRTLSRQLINAANTAEFEKIASELRYATFTLTWQIRAGLKDFPPELERRGRKAEGAAK